MRIPKISGQIFSIALLVALLAYSSAKVYGPLLAYIKISALLNISISILISYLVGRKIDALVHRRYFNFWHKSYIYSVAKFLYPLISVLFVAAFVHWSPDIRTLSRITGIPIEALLPCQHQPLSAEMDELARGIHKLRKIDSFDCDIPDSEDHAEGF